MLFRSNTKNKGYQDFSVLGVDLHSHLIPGIDDGSTSLEESIVMLQKLADLGFKKVITTPHVNSDYFRNDNSTINAGLNILKRAAAKNNIPLTIEVAAEYYIDFEFAQNIKNKFPFLTFGKNYILVEVSFFNPPDKLPEILFELQLEQYKPVLAHPERYAYWFNNFGFYEELHSRGILFQVNLNSISGYYGPDIQKMSYMFIDKNLCSFVGTDCHRIQHLEIVETVLGNKHFKKLIDSGTLLNHTL